jgi:type II secretory pathway component GspD/PulD (secretin)
MLIRSTALLAAGLLAAAAHAQTPATPAACPAARCTTATQPKLVLVPYQVTELVIPVGAKTVGSDKTGEPAKTAATCEDDLIKTIQETVAPKSWSSHGGRGTIDYFPLTMTLVINQTPEVQDQVAALLAKLRREQDTQVALEVRLVSVSEQFFERIGVDFNVPADRACGPCPANGEVKCASQLVAFLNDKQLTQFLEGAQGDQRTNVMQAPKLTLLNGQTGHVDCTDKQCFVTGLELMKIDGQSALVPKKEEVALGFRMSACPKVSADGRSVRIKLDVNQTGLASTVVPLFPIAMQVPGDKGKPVMFTQFLQQPVVNTMHVENTVTVPDGGTVLLGGLKKVSEGPAEFGPPVLSKVPYVNRLFKNVGTCRETQAVYVLVTPRVIVVDKEEEPRQTGVTRSDAPCCTTATKAAAEECEAAEAPSHGQAKAIAVLLKAYDEACAAGRTQEAAKLARAALILDPTCFARSRGK